LKKNYEVFAAVLACIGIVCIIGLIYVAGIGINSFRYRNRNYIENAILEIAPEGTRVLISGRDSRRGFTLLIGISRDYVTNDQVGGVIQEITDVFLEAMEERRVRGISILDISFVEERNRYVNWRLRWRGHGYTGGGYPDNVGRFAAKVEGQHEWSTRIPVTEVEKMIEAVFTESELTTYISERLHQLILEDSTTFIRVEPIWRHYQGTGRSPFSDLESDEYVKWDTSKICIELFVDSEQVSLNDFGEYVRENSPMIHSLLEDLDLTVYILEFWLPTYRVKWRSQSEWFYGSLRVDGERYVDISIDEMRSIIDQYLDTGL